MKKIVLTFLFLLTFHSFANEKGNGGDALVCRDQSGKITRSELLDYYEGREYRHLPHVFEGQYSHSGYLESLADKLVTFDPIRFANFKAEALELAQGIEAHLAGDDQSPLGYIFTDAPLEDVPDSRHLVMPKNCQFEQLVVRVARKYPEDPKFLIQSEILRSLRPDDLRGIIVHEAIYKVLIDSFQVKNSLAVRYLHQIITAKELSRLRFVDYIKFLQDFGVNRIDEISVKRQTQSFLAYSLIMENDFMRLSSPWVGYVMNFDGEIDLEKTLLEEKIKLTLVINESAIPKCTWNLKILATDSLGTEYALTPVRYEFERIPFGDLHLKLRIPAATRDTRECIDQPVSLEYLGNQRNVLHTYKMKNFEQVIDLHYVIKLDRLLSPVLVLK